MDAYNLNAPKTIFLFPIESNLPLNVCGTRVLHHFFAQQERSEDKSRIYFRHFNYLLLQDKESTLNSGEFSVGMLGSPNLLRRAGVGDRF